MKKILSIVAAISIMATMMTSFVTASAVSDPNLKISATVTATPMTNEEFTAAMGEGIPDGAAAYLVDVDVADLGELSHKLQMNKVVGRKVNAINIWLKGCSDKIYYHDEYEMYFVFAQSDCLGGIVEPGVDVDEDWVYGGNFAPNAAAAVPTATSTITSIDDMITFIVVLNTTESVTIDYAVGVGMDTYTTNNQGGTNPEEYQVTGKVQFGEKKTANKIDDLSDDNAEIKEMYAGKFYVVGDAVPVSDSTHYLYAKLGDVYKYSTKTIGELVEVSSDGVEYSIVPVLVVATEEEAANDYTFGTSATN